MYPVSEAFLTAVKENRRKYCWTGRITTTAGTFYTFDQEDLAKCSGYITSQCSGSTEIELGTVYAAEMGISLFSEINRYTLEGAKVELIENVSTFTMTKDDLLARADKILKRTAELAAKGEGAFKAGDHCRFCKVSAISRDILCYAMRTLSHCFIVGHVDDELIIECSRDVSMDVICGQMGRTPPWVPGLILTAAGFEAEYYKKD